MYRLWLDYDYSVSENLWLWLDYDYFLNKIDDYDYDYSLFVIDYNRSRLRDYDYSKSGHNISKEEIICNTKLLTSYFGGFTIL